MAFARGVGKALAAEDQGVFCAGRDHGFEHDGVTEIGACPGNDVIAQPIGEDGRDDAHAGIGQVFQIALVGVPADDVRRIEHRRVGGAQDVHHPAETVDLRMIAPGDQRNDEVIGAIERL